MGKTASHAAAMGYTVTPLLSYMLPAAAKILDETAGGAIQSVQTVIALQLA